MSQANVPIQEAVGEETSLAGLKLYDMIRKGHSFSGRERHCCFLNLGSKSGRFADISSATGLDFSDDGRAAARVDWDLDGDLDLWIVNRSGPQIRFLRNDLQTGHHYLAVRLVGRMSNRDAIGARVEVHVKDAPPLTQTLRAGDGFLAQSSKWLHFGLGQASQIHQIVVRWPAGNEEVITGIEVDGRYRIVEGNGQAERSPKLNRSLNLQPSVFHKPPTSDQSRTLSYARVPLPNLTYQNMEGGEVELTENLGRPVLLNLWASWCAPCVTELREFGRRESDLRTVGLHIIALSLDGLGNYNSNQTDAENILKKFRFPFEAGMANGPLLDQLQLVNNHLFEWHRSLPIPTSLLLDEQGQLAAIYKGPVDISQLLKDVTKLTLDESARRDASVPIDGQWQQPLRLDRTLMLAKAFIKAGHLVRAQEYLSKNQGLLASDPGLGATINQLGVAWMARQETEKAVIQFRRSTQVSPDLIDARLNLGLALQSQGKLDEAILNYRHIVRSIPDHIDAHFNLGMALRLQDNWRAAMAHLEQALKLNPDHVSALYNLAVILQSQKRTNEAISHYRRLIELDPDNAEAHNNLGNALDSQNKFDEAIHHYRQALLFRPDYAKAHNNLAVTLGSQGHLDEAISHFQQAIEIDPDYANAHFNLGHAMMMMGHNDQAIVYLQNAVRLKPAFRKLVQQMGVDLNVTPTSK